MKIIDNLQAGLLYYSRAKKFEYQEIFKGKRVVVIGAANSALERELGSFIDNFDIVIRINKALITYNEKNEKFIGRKTDVLIHNFHENLDDGGGGPLDWEVFDNFNLKYLVQAKTDTSGKRNVFNYFKKYKSSSKDVFMLSSKTYNFIQKLFGTYTPTRGFLGLYLALNSQAKEVYLTGFTFFKTDYADGYRDNIRSVKETLRHIDRQGFHDAELEFQNFLKILKNAEAKQILLDNKLFKILQQEELRVSETFITKNVKNLT
ncbi:glycosyltransferase family 29 protein [Algoriphagus yeomjeoni]|uniref:glycosyltransferase family 29 protein n=1 Tax=Algoriphagus yeomjeoni TaxID=291403 RepID=UPI003CE59CE3